VRFAILGGSFNPVHLGHLYLADLVLSRLGYDRIILVPACKSPFKIGAETAGAGDRLDMLLASIPADPRITVEDCELRREGVSYTIDTVLYIRERYLPEGKPGLILGDDLASGFSTWRRAGEIAELADLIIARRLSRGELGEFPYPCRVLDNEVMDLSSRMVRERIEARSNWRYLVPPGARAIIEERGLYGAGEGRWPPSSLVMDIERDVRSMLSPARFLHSRNTALLARDLALRFGLDTGKAYLAGLAHDMCKALPEGELRKLAQRDGGKPEKGKPGLLHGQAAAVFLRERYGIADGEVLEAVRFHTTGSGSMGDLARVVYIADKIEVSREGVNPELRELGCRGDLDSLFAGVFEDTLSWLKSRQMDISVNTLQLLETMQKGRTHEKTQD
jgi:nicotinate-nucleotide adenylyltransferase